ncbi:very short patch repair endonuclease [uncultured Duncaniella sp.]|uniref:very short patch repair endonuclease n=1 Tax=uncultured Duncaniella sp. TaxID=2768039 RepID=UPI0026775BA5|nr:very short patch repair endonuclease [uncultured Duncaniella sp.]
MADVMTPEQRSRCMAAIKGKDTKPEMIVRKYLFSRGLRYRVNNRKLPGSPDIVLKKYKTVVFIDGCFWHGHEGCKYYRLPKTNVDFWRHKIAMNIARDYANGVDLRLAGWKVIRVWKCAIKTKAKREETLKSLYQEIVGTEHKPNTYESFSDNIPVAAEPSSAYGINKI